MRFHPSSIISLTFLLKAQHISLASVSEFEQVQALGPDPVSPNINGMSGDYLIQTRQFDKAIGQPQKTVELEPDQYNSRVRLGFAYTLVHRNTDAEREFKKAEEISSDSLNSVRALAYVYALEGRSAEAEKMLPQLEVRPLRAGHPWMVCLVYIGLNRKEKAPCWNPLRSDLRFQDLEQHVKVALAKSDSSVSQLGSQRFRTEGSPASPRTDLSVHVGARISARVTGNPSIEISRWNSTSE